MKELVRYLGAIIILIGVALLAVYKFGTPSNYLLGGAAFAMVLGMFIHILLNRKLKD
jgi:hypothetical protein